MNSKAFTKPFSVSQIADRWSTSPKTVYEAIHAGRLRAFRPNERGYRVTLAELERFEGEVRPASSPSPRASGPRRPTSSSSRRTTSRRRAA